MKLSTLLTTKSKYISFAAHISLLRPCRYISFHLLKKPQKSCFFLLLFPCYNIVQQMAFRGGRKLVVFIDLCFGLSLQPLLVLSPFVCTYDCLATYSLGCQEIICVLALGLLHSTVSFNWQDTIYSRGKGQGGIDRQQIQRELFCSLRIFFTSKDGIVQLLPSIIIDMKILDFCSTYISQNLAVYLRLIQKSNYEYNTYPCQILVPCPIMIIQELVIPPLRFPNKPSRSGISDAGHPPVIKIQFTPIPP